MYDWMSCDGLGGLGRSPMTRRAVLASAAGLGAWWATMSPAWAQAVVRSDRRNENVLVVVFLRGGADALHMVVPHAEDAYHRARPNLAIKPKDALDLNGFFGFHPAMKAVHGRFRQGEVAVVHAVGSRDTTHSHFEAMSTMESGGVSQSDGITGGWLARHLNTTPNPAHSLRAVAWGAVLPESLRGCPEAMPVGTLTDLAIEYPSSQFELALTRACGKSDDVMAQAGRQMIEVSRMVKRMDPATAKPERGAEYPKTPTGDALREAAFLIRQNIGLQVACVDSGGWDSHVAQSYLEGQMRDLANGLDAFCRDLGSEMSRVTVVVMSEFGRRLEENSGLGTDHGGGGAMLVLGAGVKGGRVFADWPGLEKHQLADPGDLKVTTDYRTVLAELVEKRLGSSGGVFEGLSPARLGLLA